MTSDDIARYDDEKQAQLNVVLNNFLHATNQGFTKVGDRVEIFYEIDGQKKNYVYDYKKGVLTDGQ